MNKKATFFSILFTSILTISLFSYYSFNNEYALLAEERIYTLTLDSNNKPDTSSNSISVNTENNNTIDIAYTNLGNNNSGWAIIKAGGYIANTYNASKLYNNALSGLKSFTLNTTYSGATLTLYYGYSDDISTYSTHTIVSGESFNFNGQNPSFFRIVNETDSNYFPITSITLTYNCVASEIESGYALVKDNDSLKLNTNTIIVAETYDVAMSTTQNKNNRGQVAITKENDYVIINDNVQILNLVEGVSDSTYGFYTGSGYLCAASSSSNYLRTQNELTNDGSFTIKIVEGIASVVASGNYTNNILKYNNSSNLFACYGATNTQKDICIYQYTTINVNPSEPGSSEPSSEPSSSEPSSEPSSSEPSSEPSSSSSSSSGESTYTGSYYDGIDQSLRGNDLLGEVRDLIIDTHTTYVSYNFSRGGTSGKSDLVDYDPDKPGNLIMFYTKASIPNTWDNGSTYNREHVWPQSLSNGAWGESYGGSDMHHIRPTFSGTNSSRGNKLYGEVSGGDVRSETYNNVTYTAGTHDNTYWEPNDNVKGDVARIILYLFTHYNTKDSLGANNLNTASSIGTSSVPGTEKQKDLPITNVIQGNKEEAFALLIKWHKNDPVDQYEINRNNGVEPLQGNRNPFIDHPKYVDWIWG